MNDTPTNDKVSAALELSTANPNDNRLIQSRTSMAVSNALGVEEIVAQVKLIQEVMHRVMQEGEHYGTVPGCGSRKTLLQPGAQKLTMTFRLAPSYEIQESNLERGHKEYRVICTLKSMGNGSFVGQGVGCCSSMESKYRWRGGARKCPECGKETIIMGKKFKPTDPEPGWLCWAKKGGCGATWVKGAAIIESQDMNKVENDNPADVFNTCLKMAKKRAFVDATITATAASDIFTQDIGDDEGDPPPAPSPTRNKPSAPTAPRNEYIPGEAEVSGSDWDKATPAKTAQNAPGGIQTPPTPEKSPTSNPDSKVADSTGKLWRTLELLNCREGESDRQLVTNYLRALKLIREDQEVENWPAKWLPRNPAHIRDLGLCLANFKAGEPAQMPYEPAGQAARPAPPAPSGWPQPETKKSTWQSTAVPYGPIKGTALGQLPPDVQFDLWNTFQISTTKGVDGKPTDLPVDRKFRTALDEMGKEKEFVKP